MLGGQVDQTAKGTFIVLKQHNEQIEVSKVKLRFRICMRKLLP